MKKLTALSLAVLLVFTALALTAYAEESKKTFTLYKEVLLAKLFKIRNR